jgi:hypothetical protein
MENSAYFGTRHNACYADISTKCIGPFAFLRLCLNKGIGPAVSPKKFSYFCLELIEFG